MTEPNKPTPSSQARPGNDNARGRRDGEQDGPPPWYLTARRNFYGAMRIYGPRENYGYHEGKFYAGDTAVTVYMPKDWRGIKDASRPIAVSANGKTTWHHNHREARATASLGTAEIHNARSARTRRDGLAVDASLRPAMHNLFRAL